MLRWRRAPGSPLPRLVVARGTDWRGTDQDRHVNESVPHRAPEPDGPLPRGCVRSLQSPQPAVGRGAARYQACSTLRLTSASTVATSASAASRNLRSWATRCFVRPKSNTVCDAFSESARFRYNGEAGNPTRPRALVAPDRPTFAMPLNPNCG